MKTSRMLLAQTEEQVLRSYAASEANALLVVVVTGMMNEHLVKATEYLTHAKEAPLTASGAPSGAARSPRQR